MLRRFHKSIYFERDAEQEIKNILMGIDTFEFTKHFMKRFRKRKMTSIPSKERLLRGEIIEYCRNNKGLITKFIIRDKTRYNKIDVYYVINTEGRIITTWTRLKHSPLKEMLKGKEHIYEKAF